MEPSISQKQADRHRPPRLAGLRLGVLRFSVAQFLVALVFMLVAYPVVSEMHDGDLYETFFMTLSLSTAVLAVGYRRRTLAIATALMLPALAAKWLNHFSHTQVPAPVSLVASMLCLLYVAYQLFGYILRASEVDSEVLCAGVSIYLMLGLIWAFTYKLLEKFSPGAFSYASGAVSAHSMKGYTAFYYSFCTLSTVGYGDIVPVTNVARMLASMESIAGIFFSTILIARLVALYSSRQTGPPAN